MGDKHVGHALISIVRNIISELQFMIMTDEERLETRAIIKFNGGNGAILCSTCRTIIKTFATLSEEELRLMKEDNLPPQYCDKHK